MQPLVFLQEQECNARGKKASSKKVWPPKLSYHGNPPGTQKQDRFVSEDTAFFHTKFHLVEALLRENKNSLHFCPPDR